MLCILKVRATVNGTARIWNFFSSTADITSTSERGIRHEENQEKSETVRKTVLVLGKHGPGSYEGVRRSGIRRERI